MKKRSKQRPQTFHRLCDWRERYDAEIKIMKCKDFAWGTHDCTIGLAANMVKALTGQDPAAQYRGKYKTAKGALLLMCKSGFSNTGDWVASILPEIEPKKARTGDLAAFSNDCDFGFAFGVVDAQYVYVINPSGGLSMTYLEDATRAFKVG